MHKTCEHCGATFTPKSEIASTLRYFERRRFCSGRCAAEASAHRVPAAERFVANLPTERPVNECWEWAGARHKSGYGALHVDGKVQYAHRVAWEHFNGPIPHGAHVLHTCDNPPCCNPAHLFLGDAKANASDRDQKGRGKPGPPRRGVDHHMAKLSEEDVTRIRTCDTSPSELAIKYGVTRNTIKDVRRRKTWLHLP